jgi:UDP-glucose 4-epimerase
MGRRILVTGLGSFWGGRVARALESDPDVDVVVGSDTKEPRVALERTEFVRCDETYSILARLVRATQVDTVVHAGLIVDSTRSGSRRIHERNVIGTMNLLAAVGSSDSAVRQLVVKSSTLVYGASARDPTWFAEDTARSSPARTPIERSLVEVESHLQTAGEEQPGLAVAVLRFANVLGEEIVTPLSRALALPAVPCIAGFDPQLQFVAETDVVRALVHAVRAGLVGTYNVAADGRLPWSEIATIVGKPRLPLSPYGTGLVVAPLDRLGLLELPPEVRDLLRFGRGADNRRFAGTGFRYQFTTAGAVRMFAEHQRLARSMHQAPTYRYESEVEAFFRHSPAVVRPS